MSAFLATRTPSAEIVQEGQLFGVPAQIPRRCNAPVVVAARQRLLRTCGALLACASVASGVWWLELELLYWLGTSAAFFPFFIAVSLFAEFRGPYATVGLGHLPVLHRGALVQGTVVNSHPEAQLEQCPNAMYRLSYRYFVGDRAFVGEFQTQNRRVLDTFTPGTSLAVLYHPRRPWQSLAPELLGLSFDGVKDLRPGAIGVEPLRVSQRTEQTSTSRITHLRRPTYGDALWVQMAQSWFPELLRALETTPRPAQGWVEVRPESLVQQSPLDHSSVVSVSLEQPFCVELSVWLRDEDTLWLHVQVRQKGAMDAKQEVHFSCVLPQCAVVNHVPRKMGNYPRIAPGEFVALWRVLTLHAHLHGTGLGPFAAVNPTAKPVDRTRELLPL